MTRQRVFHILVFLLASFCVPPGVLAQTLSEITEPDNTYLRYQGDGDFRHYPPSQQVGGDSIFTLLGRWAWGYCLAVDTKDHYAFIGNGPTFQALDMSNPASPTIVGEYTVVHRINDIVVQGNLAYVAMATGFVVMDIADPMHPQQIGTLSLSGIPQQLVVEDSFAYVLSWSTGIMHVVDVSNPAQPVRRIGFVADEFAYCIAVKSRYIYLGIPNRPVLRIVNATNLDTLTYRDTSMAFVGRTATTVDTLLLIGATSTPELSRVLKVLSIANPAHPRVVGEVAIPGRSSNTGGIRVVGSKAYLAVLDTGVVEVDIANPSQPQIQRVLNRKPFSPTVGITSVSGVGVAATSSDLFVGCYTGLLTIDKSQPDSLREVSFFASGGDPIDVVVKDSLAYVASYLSGFWIIDVSNASHPHAVANLQNGGRVSRVTVEEGIAFVLNSPVRLGDTTQGLWVIDVSNPNVPRFLSHHQGIVRYTPSEQPNAIAVLGKLVFVSQSGGWYNDSTLEVIDVSDPMSPTQLSVVRGGYSPWDIAVKDGILYVATPDSGIIIVDARVPEQPLRVGKDLHTSYCLAVVDTLLFSISGADSFLTFSSSTPFLLRYFGGIRLTTPNVFEEHLSVSREYVYAARGGVSLIDVHNPVVPIERGTSSLFHNATSVAAMSNTVVASDVLGLWILRNKLIAGIKDRQPNLPVTGFELCQNHPNPFNPTTSIRFYLPQSGRTKLEVFDLLGRSVVVPLDSYMQEGEYSVLVDGSHLSSGVYLYRLTSSLGSVTRRMLLIK